MTEIRIRHEMNVRAIPLGDVPLLEMDKVIPLLQRWGVYLKDDAVAADDFSGQFTVVADQEAYFEVQLHDEE